jgi:Tfp pilus assembly protein PilF
MIVRLLILCVLGIYLATGMWAGSIRYPTLLIGPAILAYLGLAAYSAATSPYRHQSVQWLVVLLGYAALLYVLVWVMERWDHVAELFGILVAMGLFEASWALVQAGWLDTARPTGTFFNPNFLAGYLAAVFVIVVGYVCYARFDWIEMRRRVHSNLLHRIRPFVSIAILATMFVVIIMTGSRGGTLALLLGTTLVLGMRFGRKGVGLLVLLFLIFLLVPSPLRERLRAEHVANPVGYARWQIWQGSVRAMMDHPWGIGLGLYQYVFPLYTFPVEGQIARYGRVAQTPHSEYLQMGVELGAVSILVFGWGIVLVTREAASVLRLRLRRWERGVVVGACGAMAAILAHAAVDSNLHEPALAIVLTLCVGLIVSTRRLTARAVDSSHVMLVRSYPLRLLVTGVGALALGMLAVSVVRLGFAWTAYEDAAQALARQDFPQAVASYQTAIALDPGKALYHSAIAAAYFQLFERNRDAAMAQAAVAELQAAMALNPLDGRLAALLGHVYASLASSSRAGAAPSSAEHTRRVSWLNSAVSAYHRAVELEPFNPFYRLDLGDLYLALGDLGQAEALARQAIEFEPNFLPGRRLLATIYLRSGRPDDADREYREILDRQRRYAGVKATPFEERFLKVETASLAAALERARRHS